MRPTEILDAFRLAVSNHDLARRIDDLLIAVHAADFFSKDVSFMQYSHDKYLPAAKEYREYLLDGGCRSGHCKKFLELRGRMGGVSRAMYHRQEETFNKLVDVLTHTPLKPFLTPAFKNEIWKHFKQLERKWLSQSRP